MNFSTLSVGLRRVGLGRAAAAAGLGALLAAVTLVASSPQPLPEGTDNPGLDRLDQATLPLDGTFTPDGDGRGVNVFIIDSGVYAAHREFSGRIVGVGNFFRDPPNPDDVDDCATLNGWEGHGTHVASYAAGARYGVAKRATIYVLKAVDSTCNTTPAAVTRAVDWVVAHATPPGVINISTGDGVHAAVQTHLLRAINAGFVVTMSAGNNPDVGRAFGDLADRAIIAAVTDASDTAQRADYGAGLTVYTPGVGTRSAACCGNPDASHVLTTSGPWPECGGRDRACDSYAAPFAAGVIAAYLSLHPDATPAEIRERVIERAARGVVRGLPPGSRTPNRLLQTLGRRPAAPGDDDHRERLPRR